MHIPAEPATYANEERATNPDAVPSQRGIWAIAGVLALFPFMYLVATAFFRHSFELAFGYIAALELVAVVVVLSERRGPVRLGLPRWVRYLLVAWLVAITLSTVFAFHPASALVRHAEWLVHVLFGYCVWTVAREGKGEIVAAAVALGFALVAAYVIVFWFRLDDPATYSWKNGIPLFLNIRQFGMYAIAGLFFAVPFLGRGRTWRSKRHLFGLVVSVVAWGSLFWSGGRGALLAAFVGTALLVLLALRQQRLTFAAWIVLAGLVGGAGSLAFSTQGGSTGVVRALNKTRTATSASTASNGRLTIWRRAVNAVQERPVLGWGPSGSRFVLTHVNHGRTHPDATSDKVMSHEHAHNLTLDALIEWGVVGALAFALLLVAALFTALRRVLRAHADASAPIALGVVGYLAAALVMGLFDGVTTNAEVCILLVVAIALALSYFQSDAFARLPGGSRTLYMLTAYCAVVLLADLTVRSVIAAPGVPDPQSARVEVLKRFPSPFEAHGTALAWGREWGRTDPQAGIAIARWVRDRDRDPRDAESLIRFLEAEAEYRKEMDGGL